MQTKLWSEVPKGRVPVVGPDINVNINGRMTLTMNVR